MKHYNWKKIFSAKNYYCVKTISKRLKRSTRTILENWKKDGLQIEADGEIYGNNLIMFLEQRFPSKKNCLNDTQMYCTCKKQVITIGSTKNITIKYLETTGKFQLIATCYNDFCKEKLCTQNLKAVNLAKFISFKIALIVFKNNSKIFDIEAKNKMEELILKGETNE